MSEKEKCAAIGNVCAPSSVSVMNRIAVAYAHDRAFTQLLCMQPVESATRQVSLGKLKGATHTAVQLEVKTAAKMKFLENNFKPAKKLGERVSKAKQQKYEQYRKEARETASALARARQKVVDEAERVRRANGHKPSGRPSQSSVKHRVTNAAVTMLL